MFPVKISLHHIVYVSTDGPGRIRYTGPAIVGRTYSYLYSFQEKYRIRKIYDFRLKTSYVFAEELDVKDRSIVK
jgi:hypothetical protein